MDNQPEPLSTYEKWVIAVLIGVLFLILSSPLLYMFTDGIGKYVKLTILDKQNRPTTQGLIIHALLFIVLIRILMR